MHIGGSNSDRWRNCAGSPRAEADIPEKYREEGEAAAAGTVAHSLAARSLLDPKFHPVSVLDDTIDGAAVDADMISAVVDYRDYVRRSGELIWVEKQVSPIPELSGTLDCCALDGPTLLVIDFKSGFLPVYARENYQLKFYALGALNQLDDCLGITAVRLVIVQPRIGNTSEWDTTPEELRADAASLAVDFAATQDPEAPRVPGPWCKWCDANPICPELEKEVLEFMKMEDLPTDPDELKRQLELCDEAAAFAKNRRRAIFVAMRSGIAVTGQKLVRTVKRRVFKDPDAVRKAAREEGVLEKLTTEPELKSVRQVELLMGKDWVKPYAHQEEGELTIAPIDDKRRAEAPTVAAEFGLETKGDK